MRLAVAFAGACLVVAAIGSSRAHSGSGSGLRANFLGADFQKKESGGAKAQGGVETPMATDERLERNGWWPTKATAAAEEFVGTKECARCHAKITATQLTTPMARAASLAGDAEVLREHPRIAREMGKYAYAMVSADGVSNYSVSAAGSASDGAGTAAVQVGWAFGLGNKGQTYVYQRDGNYYESRVSFYKSLQGLDLTTGHEGTTPRTLEDALGRALDAGSAKHCFGCHTTGASTRAGFEPARATMGVTCEACHGPGARHGELMDEEKNEEGRAAVLDAGGLSAVAQVDFCGACHRTANDVYEMGMTGVQTVRFQPYRLEQSKCWGDGAGDARLKCTACHDPHQPLVREAGTYDGKCLACHVVAGMKATRERAGKACPVGKKDCVTCHMPRVEVASMHAPFVDHRIRVVRAREKYPD
jgi:hypothetical protein